MKSSLPWPTHPALFLILVWAASLPSLMAQAPSPPLPVEMLFGHNSLYFQVVVKKNFAPQSRFGYFTVATYTADYENDVDQNSIVIPVQFNYSIGKGFGLMAGTDINSVSGFAPIIGPQYNYASRQFLAVTVVSFFLNPDRDVKLFGLYEYKPPLKENWSFYSRLQFVYNQSIREASHNKSYLYLRAGFKRKSLVFGIGGQPGTVGSLKVYEDNYGVFFRWEFR